MDELITVKNTVYVKCNENDYIHYQFDSSSIKHKNKVENFVHDRMIVDDKNLN